MKKQTEIEQITKKVMTILNDSIFPEKIESLNQELQENKTIVLETMIQMLKNYHNSLTRLIGRQKFDEKVILLYYFIYRESKSLSKDYFGEVKKQVTENKNIPQPVKSLLSKWKVLDNDLVKLLNNHIKDCLSIKLVITLLQLESKEMIDKQDLKDSVNMFNLLPKNLYLQKQLIALLCEKNSTDKSTLINLYLQIGLFYKEIAQVSDKSQKKSHLKNSLIYFQLGLELSTNSDELYFSLKENTAAKNIQDDIAETSYELALILEEEGNVNKKETIKYLFDAYTLGKYQAGLLLAKHCSEEQLSIDTLSYPALHINMSVTDYSVITIYTNTFNSALEKNDFPIASCALQNIKKLSNSKNDQQTEKLYNDLKIKIIDYHQRQDDKILNIIVDGLQIRTDENEDYLIELDSYDCVRILSNLEPKDSSDERLFKFATTLIERVIKNKKFNEDQICITQATNYIEKLQSNYTRQNAISLLIGLINNFENNDELEALIENSIMHLLGDKYEIEDLKHCELILNNICKINEIKSPSAEMQKEKFNYFNYAIDTIFKYATALMKNQNNIDDLDSLYTKYKLSIDGNVLIRLGSDEFTSKIKKYFTTFLDALLYLKAREKYYECKSYKDIQSWSKSVNISLHDKMFMIISALLRIIKTNECISFLDEHPSAVRRLMDMTNFDCDEFLNIKKEAYDNAIKNNSNYFFSCFALINEMIYGNIFRSEEISTSRVKFLLEGDYQSTYSYLYLKAALNDLSGIHVDLAITQLSKSKDHEQEENSIRSKIALTILNNKYGFTDESIFINLDDPPKTSEKTLCFVLDEIQNLFNNIKFIPCTLLSKDLTADDELLLLQKLKRSFDMYIGSAKEKNLLWSLEGKLNSAYTELAAKINNLQKNIHTGSLYQDTIVNDNLSNSLPSIDNLLPSAPNDSEKANITVETLLPKEPQEIIRTDLSEERAVEMIKLERIKAENNLIDKQIGLLKLERAMEKMKFERIEKETRLEELKLRNLQLQNQRRRKHHTVKFFGKTRISQVADDSKIEENQENTNSSN